MNLVFKIPFARQILLDIVSDNKRRMEDAEKKLKAFDDLPQSVLDSGVVSEKDIFPEVFLDNHGEQE